MNTERIIMYEPIDIEGLATILAEDAWKEEVKAKGLTKDQLYENGQVRSEWASSFFLLRDAFLDLINQFKTPLVYETCAKAG